MRPGLPSAYEALARRAEQTRGVLAVNARLLRDAAEALRDLAYIGQHGGAWEQRIAREGRGRIDADAPTEDAPA